MPQLVWLITGCSSGFGEEFVRQILGRGDKVIATARNVGARLNHLKELGAAVVEIDISHSQEEINAKVEAAVQIHGHVDVLVNNAGYVASGVTEEATKELFQQQFDTNLFGSIAMTRALLPHFRSRRSGMLVFIGSPYGVIGIPALGPYCGSKFALEGVYEALKQEVAPFGIQSMMFEPGHFRTGALESSRRGIASESISDYAELNEMGRSITAGLHRKQPGDPEKGVKIMIDIVKGEGVMEGRTLPERLPLGPDSLEMIRKKCRDTLAICDEWETVISSTDFTSATG